MFVCPSCGRLVTADGVSLQGDTGSWEAVCEECAQEIERRQAEEFALKAVMAYLCGDILDLW